MMQVRFSRTIDQPQRDIQRGNATWWSGNPMTYDWRDDITFTPGSPEWFEEVDRRFIRASRPYLTTTRPFDRIMPDDLHGRRVLEIGCGMGLHSLELARRGAEVHAIDLTEAAVVATRTRMQKFGVDAEILRADAESLPFERGTFDFVWSWGVIHHSPRTARIVREIARVLKPGGQTRVMVYNREGSLARLTLLRHHVIGGGFMRQSPDETLWQHADGYSARYYHKEQFEDLFRGFFETVSSVLLGQDPDVMPLPRQVRTMIMPRMSDEQKLAIASRLGGFIFLTASQPLSR